MNSFYEVKVFLQMIKLRQPDLRQQMQNCQSYFSISSVVEHFAIGAESLGFDFQAGVLPRR